MLDALLSIIERKSLELEFTGCAVMVSKAATLGQFVNELMAKHDYTNRSLAAAAGVSESAVRNLLKFGVDPHAKDPDARTLSQIAKALEVDALRLFRLAGYVPPQPDAHSVRAEYVADTFDELPAEKQDAVLGVLEAMTERITRKTAIQQMRTTPHKALAGIELNFPPLLRSLANQLIVQEQLVEPQQADMIGDDVQILHFRWGSLPTEVREHIRALIRHKLSLDYDPTMVDPKWRT